LKLYKDYGVKLSTAHYNLFGSSLKLLMMFISRNRLLNQTDQGMNQ